MVESSFFNIQLHDALPGFINEAPLSVPSSGIFLAGRARSVPNVDSAIVFRLPRVIILQDVFHGKVDCGFSTPFVNTSGASGKFILYSLSAEYCCNDVPQYVLPSAASVINIHTFLVLNSAGYTHPFGPGDGVP